MARRKVRDVYGNWTYEDDDSQDRSSNDTLDNVATDGHPSEKNEDVIHLEWRDWIALALASFETILLPILVLVILLVVLAVALPHI